MVDKIGENSGVRKMPLKGQKELEKLSPKARALVAVAVDVMIFARIIEEIKNSKEFTDEEKEVIIDVAALLGPFSLRRIPKEVKKNEFVR